MQTDPTLWNIVMGYFNATLGQKQEPVAVYIGRFGIAQRNEMGDMLLNFMIGYKYATNSKWTWISPSQSRK